MDQVDITQDYFFFAFPLKVYFHSNWHTLKNVKPPVVPEQFIANCSSTDF